MSTLNTSAASYDQGMDIQPNASWANKDLMNQKTTTTTTTTKTLAVNPTTNTTSASMTKTLNPPAAQQLEQNLNPIDKQDPKAQTKALPFAAASSTEVQQEVQSSTTNNYTIQSHEQPEHDDDSMDHNGNILDRTMDKVRSWVHSFQPVTMSHADEREDSTSSAVAGAKSKLMDVKGQVSSTVGQLSDNVSGAMNTASNKVSDVVGTVKTQANTVLHNVQDKAAQAVTNVKTQVTDYVHSHQSQPGEPLTTTIAHNLSSALPSQSTIQNKVTSIIPPLAEEGSQSYAFMTSFGNRYISTWKDFAVALQKQSYPLQFMTALILVTHLVVPVFFFDKGAARSVMYCYVISSILSHLTFFLSGHLRYMFLAHLVFVPMLISLVLHAGFDEAYSVAQISKEYQNEQMAKAVVMAPFSLRSYFFVIWLRVVMMIQSALYTLDTVNVLDLLGLSLTTKSGQEMVIIKKRVKQIRKQVAHAIEPPSAQLENSNMATQTQEQGTTSASGTPQITGSMGQSSIMSSSSSTNIPGVSSAPSQKWTPQASASTPTNDKHVEVQSHEQESGSEDQVLRKRNPNLHTA